MNERYAGMTVHERLFVSGLMDEFDHAVMALDVNAVVAMLMNVEVNDETLIKEILSSLGLGIDQRGNVEDQ